MKKIYTTFLVVGFVAATGFAQQRIAEVKTVNLPVVSSSQQTSVQPMGVVDTLVNHWDRIDPDPSVDTAVIYSVKGGNGGFVAGQNKYGGIATCQKFDPAYGVTSGGNIKGLLFWFGRKKQGAGTAMFTPTIWADNNGTPGAVLGTAPAFLISSIDTAAAATKLLYGPQGLHGAYNVSAAFTSPVAIPANQTFWAGMTFTYANGDSAGLVSSRDGASGDAPGLTGNFPAAKTHTFEQKSNNSWQSFNDGTNQTWRLDIALAVYPVVDLGLGVNENNGIITYLQNSPNPAVNNTIIKYELKEASANIVISVYDITGNEVASYTQGVQNAGKHNLKMDISNLSAGMYFYTLKADSYHLTNKMSVEK